jgi:hypothetical protein
LAQEISNTLHILVKQRYKATGALLLALERRTEVISGEFNSENVVNTLWALGVCDDGDKAGGADDGAAGAAAGGGNISSWSGGRRRYQGSSTRSLFQTHCGQCASSAYSLIFLFGSVVPCPAVCCSLSCSFPSIDFENQKSLCQLHQFFISSDMISQQQVSDTLRGIGLSVEDEFRCPKSGYSIDMRVLGMRVNTKSSIGSSAGWAVEYDGPSHFLTCRLSIGGTLMKRWHLELLGYTVVKLPFGNGII